MIRLLERLKRRPTAPDLAGLTVTVYTREGCGCCGTALDVLGASQKVHGFDVRTVDVDSDPDLASRFGGTVPVVEIGGKVRFRGKVNPVLLERLLDAEARARFADATPAGDALDGADASR